MSLSLFPPPGGFDTPVYPYSCQTSGAHAAPHPTLPQSNWRFPLLTVEGQFARSNFFLHPCASPPPQTAPDSHSPRSVGRGARRTCREGGGHGEQQENLAECSGHGHPAAALALRGPGAELGSGTAPAALKFPGRWREAQPHSL